LAYLTHDREAVGVFTTEKVGRTRELTPEGFLLCRDVRIARTGEMLYAPGEVPVEPSAGGIIRCTRSPEDLFSPAAIASYVGKAVTIDHPDEDVTPETWKELAVGIVLNPHRGEGADVEYLMADLLITEQRGIDALGGEEGNEEWEVSCGYDAEYEQTGPGRARQHSFIGNHVALVDKGRCGPACRIGDSDMATRDQRRSPKRSWKDRIMTAFKARDEAALEEAMGMAEDEITNGVEGGEGSEAVSGPSEHKIVIEVKSPSDPSSAVESQEAQGAGTGDDGEEEQAPGWFSKARAEDKVWRDGIEERLGKLEGGTGDEESEEAEERSETDDEESEETEREETSDEVSEGEAAEKEEGARDRARTGDSATFKTAFQDMIVRAEILAPGIKLPTFDAKAKAGVTRDRMCAFKRRALVEAMKDQDNADLIKGLLPGGDASKLTCDSVGIAFVGASELVKQANSDIGVQGYVIEGGGGSGPAKIADINQKNREFWRSKGGAL
jgi:hypothetical protein